MTMSNKKAPPLRGGVNFKSNTMKNTSQIYEKFYYVVSAVNNYFGVLTKRNPAIIADGGRFLSFHFSQTKSQIFKSLIVLIY